MGGVIAQGPLSTLLASGRSGSRGAGGVPVKIVSDKINS